METDKEKIIIQQNSNGKGCLWTIIGIQFFIIFLVVITFVVIGLTVAGGISSGIEMAKSETFTNKKASLYGQDEYPNLTEIWSSGPMSAETKVVRIPITGFITLNAKESVFGSSLSSTAMALAAIKRATMDDNIKAIILDVNSGGGGITASDIVYHALMKFKEYDPDRKIVAIFGDVAASGAYYISMASDYIVARPTTVTGSLSVIMQSVNVYELAQKIGIQDVTITSGNNKDMLNPLKQVNPDQQALLKIIIEQMHERFVEVIVQGRKLTKEEVNKLADGRIFTAKQALEQELIDEIGYYEDAQDICADLLDVEDIRVYKYEQQFDWKSVLGMYGRFNLADLLKMKNTETTFQYRWQP
jgi:protease-4